jgi:hypothetical protein
MNEEDKNTACFPKIHGKCEHVQQYYKSIVRRVVAKSCYSKIIIRQIRDSSRSCIQYVTRC